LVGHGHPAPRLDAFGIGAGPLLDPVEQFPHPGSVLLAVGVALERQGGAGPVEAGRRLVDVVGERFS